jgi:hypothetical protein
VDVIVLVLWSMTNFLVSILAIALRGRWIKVRHFSRGTDLEWESCHLIMHAARRKSPRDRSPVWNPRLDDASSSSKSVMVPHSLVPVIGLPSAGPLLKDNDDG